MRSLVAAVACAAVWVATVARAAPATGPSASADPAVDAAQDFAMAVRAADADKLAHALAITNADEQMLRDGLVRNLLGLGRLRTAMVERFGRDAAGRFGVGPVDEADAWSKATVRQDTAGTQVVLTLGGKTVRLPMVRQDGQWKVSFAAVTAYAASQGVTLDVPSDEPLRRWNETAAALKTAADAVRNGQFATAAAAGDAAERAFSDAVRGVNAN